MEQQREPAVPVAGVDWAGGITTESLNFLIEALMAALKVGPR